MTKIMQEARKFVYVARKNEVNPKIKGALPENRVCLLDVEPKDTTKTKIRGRIYYLQQVRRKPKDVSQSSVSLNSTSGRASLVAEW